MLPQHSFKMIEAPTPDGSRARVSWVDCGTVA